MDSNKIKRLDELKKRNKEIQNKAKVEKNLLLNECLNALDRKARILSDDVGEEVYSIFKKKISFLPWGIDWEKCINTKIIRRSELRSDVFKSNEFFIIWNKDLPIIKSDLATIITNVDDICAVQFDTWLFASDYKEVVEFHHEGKITIGDVT